MERRDVYEEGDMSAPWQETRRQVQEDWLLFQTRSRIISKSDENTFELSRKWAALPQLETQHSHCGPRDKDKAADVRISWAVSLEAGLEPLLSVVLAEHLPCYLWVGEHAGSEERKFSRFIGWKQRWGEAQRTDRLRFGSIRQHQQHGQQQQQQQCQLMPDMKVGLRREAVGCFQSGWKTRHFSNLCPDFEFILMRQSWEPAHPPPTVSLSTPYYNLNNLIITFRQKTTCLSNVTGFCESVKHFTM